MGENQQSLESHRHTQMSVQTKQKSRDKNIMVGYSQKVETTNDQQRLGRA